MSRAYPACVNFSVTVNAYSMCNSFYADVYVALSQAICRLSLCIVQYSVLRHVLALSKVYTFCGVFCVQNMDLSLFECHFVYSFCISLRIMLFVHVVDFSYHHSLSLLVFRFSSHDFLGKILTPFTWSLHGYNEIIWMSCATCLEKKQKWRVSIVMCATPLDFSQVLKWSICKLNAYVKWAKCSACFKWKYKYFANTFGCKLATAIRMWPNCSCKKIEKNRFFPNWISSQRDVLVVF